MTPPQSHARKRLASIEATMKTIEETVEKARRDSAETLPILVGAHSHLERTRLRALAVVTLEDLDRGRYSDSEFCDLLRELADLVLRATTESR